MKKLVTIATIVLTILVVGCSEQNNAPKKVQGDSQKPKTVIVNTGMSKKEEDILNKRLADLEDKVNDESGKHREQGANSAENAVRAAAEDYYAAAANGNYTGTYSKLSSYSQSQITEDEWVADNVALGSDAGIYNIDSVEMVDDTTANVYLTITSSDGSSFERFTQFVLEDSIWKHDLTQEEYDLFAGTTTSASVSASASDTPSASASASEAPSGGGGVPPISENNCPASHPIKGNGESGIYHVPGGQYYDVTNPEECFASEADASAAGYRASER